MAKLVQKIIETARQISKVPDEARLCRLQDVLTRIEERFSKIRHEVVPDWLEPYQPDFEQLSLQALKWAYVSNVTDTYPVEELDSIKQLVVLHELIERAQGIKRKRTVGERQMMKRIKQLIPLSERFRARWVTTTSLSACTTTSPTQPTTSPSETRQWLMPSSIFWTSGQEVGCPWA